MVNGLGVLGWGVGGIEAEACMLGQPISMLIPDVLGFRLTGRLPEGATATDLVLTITEQLRKHGVVGKFVEFYGPGLDHLPIADRATLSNMCPEYGATVAIFPVDEMTLDYLRLTGREESRVRLVQEYARAQGMFRAAGMPDADYAERLELDLASVEPSIAGPRRPQDRVTLHQARASFEQALAKTLADRKPQAARVGSAAASAPAGVGTLALDHGAVVIASITSCTNTSNPSVMIGAGLLAKKAVERGLRVKPWVKTSLAPGSKAVTQYLARRGADALPGSTGLPPGRVRLRDLHREQRAAPARGVGGGEGERPGSRGGPQRQQELRRPHPAAGEGELPGVAAAGGGVRPGRFHDDRSHRGSARAGTPRGRRSTSRTSGRRGQEIQAALLKAVSAESFRSAYSDVFGGDERWQGLQVPTGDRFQWAPDSTYIRHPPFFEGLTLQPVAPSDIVGGRALALLGDSVTTDHISPAGSIPADSPAGKYLIAKGVEPRDFNSYGARRGNHEVMMRGTFANIRLRNQLAPGTEGGWTRHLPGGEQMTIYDAAMRYKQDGIPLLVLAGKEYGSGSSRDWAAKGTLLLGVKAVIAESFERIHRSNLVNMGVLPLEFPRGRNAASLGLSGTEAFSIAGIADGLRPAGEVQVEARPAEGPTIRFSATVRIDTPEELAAYKAGGILPYVLRQLVGK